MTQPKAVYEGLAFIVSVDNYAANEEEVNQYSDKLWQSDISMRTSSNDVLCTHKLNQFHEEADQIAEVFKRFDEELVLLRNPDQREFEAAWKDVAGRIGDKVLFFAFVGHGTQTENGLEAQIKDDESFAMEAKCLELSATTPVVAFFNCTRPISYAELRSPKFQPVLSSRFAFVYSCQMGQIQRSYQSTVKFVKQISNQLSQKRAFQIPVSLQKLKDFGQMNCVQNFSRSIAVKTYGLSNEQKARSKVTDSPEQPSR